MQTIQDTSTFRALGQNGQYQSLSLTTIPKTHILYEGLCGDYCKIIHCITKDHFAEVTNK